MKSQGKKVFVGLSGGVDSAVSAALLKKQNFDVTGVFIKAWDPSTELRVNSHQKYPCTWREDRRSAMRVCAVLDVPFITLDLEKEYKKQVVDYMINEYKKGKTPNPDVMCNKEIKFGAFLDFALKNDADFVATGHYARVRIKNNEYGIMEGKDKQKDQSYFLWTLTQAQLKHTLFPVGHLQKEEVRKLATKFKLPQATRKDSQGLCFLGQIDMKEFLKEYIKPKKGKVLLAPRSFSEVGNEKGEVIGEHNGALLYTLGERHGFKILNKETESEPLYVISKDIKKNTITVAPQTTKITTHSPKGQWASLYSIKEMNWISGETPNKEIECRFRYRQEKIKCRVEKNKVIFKNPELIASGQSIVFYENDVCLGGGIIS